MGNDELGERMRQLLSRAICALIGHRREKCVELSMPEQRFYWSEYRCERCGKDLPLWHGEMHLVE